MDWLDLALKIYIAAVGIHFAAKFIKPNRGISIYRETTHSDTENKSGASRARHKKGFKIPRRISRAMPGKADFEIPKDIGYGEKKSALVTIHANQSAAESVVGQHGLKATNKIVTAPTMLVRLSSADCKVDDVSEKTQVICQDSPTKWLFYITPNSYPVAQLRASISIMVDHNGNQVSQEVLEKFFTIHIYRTAKYTWHHTREGLMAAGAVAAIIALFIQ